MQPDTAEVVIKKEEEVQLVLFTERFNYAQEFTSRLKVLSKLGSKVAKTLMIAHVVGINPELASTDSADFFSVGMKDQKMIGYANKKIKAKDVKDIWLKNRSEVKAGKIVRKVLNDKGLEYYHITDKDIEDFTNGWNTMVLAPDERFVVARGETVRKYYNRNNYVTDSGGSLHRSCMSGADKQGQLNLYVQNPQVKLLVLKKNNQVAARALMWCFVEKGKTYKVIDRVYFAKEVYCTLYKMWAIKYGAWIKAGLGSVGGVGFMNPETLETEPKIWKVKLNQARHNLYPYIDTFNNICLETSEVSNERFTGSRSAHNVGGILG